MRLTILYIAIFFFIVHISACTLDKNSSQKNSVHDSIIKKDSVHIENKKVIFDTLHTFIVVIANGLSNKIDLSFKRKIQPVSEPDEMPEKFHFLDSMTKIKGTIPYQLALNEGYNISYYFLSATADSIKNIDISNSEVQYINKASKSSVALLYNSGIIVVDINDDKIQDLLSYYPGTPRNPLYEIWFGTKNGKYKHKNNFFRDGNAFYGFDKHDSHILITGWRETRESTEKYWNIIKDDTLQPFKGYLQSTEDHSHIMEIYNFKNGKKTINSFKIEKIFYKELKKMNMAE